MSTVRNLLKNVTALSVGQLVTRGLSIVYIAALARYIRPTGMGQLATAQSLTSITFLFVNLGFDVLAARDVAQDRSRGPIYFSNIFAIKGVFSLVALIVLPLMGLIFGYDLETQRAIWVYSLVTLLGATTAIGKSVLMANERLEIDALLQFGRDIINIGLSLLVIQLRGTLLQIIWVSVFANFGHTLVEVFVLYRLRMVNFVMPKLEQIRRIIKVGMPFGAVSLLSALYLQIGPVLLSLLSGSQMTGYYWVAFNLTAALLILPSVYSQAVLPVFSRFFVDPGSKMQVGYQKSFKLLTTFGMPLAVGTMLLASPLVKILYGAGYDESVVALRLLAIPIALMGNYAAGSALTAMGKQKLLSIFYIIAISSMALLDFLLIPVMGITGASLAYIIPIIFGFLYLNSICHRLLGLQLPLKAIATALSASMLMAMVVLVCERIGVHFLILGGLVGPIVYTVMFSLLGGIDSDEKQLFRLILGPTINGVIRSVRGIE